MKRVTELRNVLMELYFEGALNDFIDEVVGWESESVHLKFSEIHDKNEIARMEIVTTGGDHVLMELEYKKYCFESVSSTMVGMTKNVHLVESFDESLKRKGIDRWIRVLLTDASDDLLGSPHRISRVVTYGNGTLDSQYTIMECHVIDLGRWQYESNKVLKSWFKWLADDSLSSDLARAI